MTTRPKAKTEPLKLTLHELIAVRGLVGCQIDILDGELDNEQNKEDVTISRTKMLKDRKTLEDILTKLMTTISKSK